MGKKDAETPESAEDLDELDAAFDNALEGLSAANDKVSNVLETMDDPDAAPPEVEFAEYSEDDDASDDEVAEDDGDE
jgi:hypothetical protein